MMYYIAASVPAEIRSIDLTESNLYSSMVLDISCSRWSEAFKKSKVLQMPTEFQSQLYINAKSKFRSSRICPSQGQGNQQLNNSARPLTVRSSDGTYVPSSSSTWGEIFK